MNAADSTPMSPNGHADLMDSARARAVHLRQQAKADFVNAIIRRAVHTLRSISNALVQKSTKTTPCQH